MQSTQPAGYFAVEYTDNNGQPKIAKIKAHTFIEATSEFNTVYNGCYIERGTIHQWSATDEKTLTVQNKLEREVAAL